MPERPTVIYDGDCRVCGRFIRLVRRWDRRGRLEVLPYQDPSVAARFPFIPAAALREALQLVEPGGRVYAGAKAVERILELLPAGGALSWAFSMPLIGPLLDRGYRWFARNRYRFGCGDHCALPPR